MICVEYVNNESLDKWQQWLSPIMIALVVISSIVSMAGKHMTISYIIRYAPKSRPLNVLIFLDKVRRV